VWVDFRLKSDFEALLTGETLISEGPQTDYDRGMPKLSRGHQLREAYRFAGFFPASTVRGVFGDPQKRVLTLRRSQKKQRVEFVTDGTATSTIRSYVGCETCPAASIASIWSCPCAESDVGVAAR
jgi:hypothetical protein